MPKVNLIGLLLSQLCFLVGCGEEASPIGEPVGRMTDRKLGFGITEGNIGYELAFASAKNAGIQFIELPQQWDEVELADGDYQSQFVAMANEVYPQLETSLVLSMNPIDTAANRVPKHLLDADWDSHERIDAFNRWFDWTIAQLSDAQIVAVSVGNEVDAYFTSHPDEIEAYARFYEQVAGHIREQIPNAVVGCKMTFPGRTGSIESALASIDSHSDAIMLTYYPLNDQFQVRDPSEVSRDFEKMVSLTDQPVYLLETGYPSGAKCQSSQARQAEFVDALFEAWDKQVNEVPVVNLVWTCDLPKSQVDSMVQYYAVQQLAYREYLQTLGLRTADGTNKAAFERVRENVRERVQSR
ncbi:glycosyl hydrolase 53 family protein [Stieleria sp. JC731]|uniref:glycosyl hydrolase 53 family protein n=1 Tax=Pirellulaceae TaxID=2691357 RepID=UPI001E34F672|nr:glycosyl hydrolase 53 family protein [Stieleria sp. JC731]MCC9603129.1 glycosyl hydrolase 53 family protein [Stieleria sp. JC731]